MKTIQSKNEFVENFLKEREADAESKFNKDSNNKGKTFTFIITDEGKKLLIQQALSMYSLYLSTSNIPVYVPKEPVVINENSDDSIYHYVKNRVTNNILFAVLTNTDYAVGVQECFTNKFIESLGEFIDRVSIEKDNFHNRKNHFFNESLVNYAKFFANNGTENQFFEAVILILTYKFKSPLSQAHTPPDLFSLYYNMINENQDKIAN